MLCGYLIKPYEYVKRLAAKSTCSNKLPGMYICDLLIELNNINLIKLTMVLIVLFAKVPKTVGSKNTG